MDDLIEEAYLHYRQGEKTRNLPWIAFAMMAVFMLIIVISLWSIVSKNQQAANIAATATAQYQQSSVQFQQDMLLLLSNFFANRALLKQRRELLFPTKFLGLKTSEMRRGACRLKVVNPLPINT
jgi:hypothetical protein